MSRTVLVALDGSAASQKALGFAAELAPDKSDKFVLVNVITKREVPEAVRKFAKSEHIDGPPEWVYEKVIAENILKGGKRLLRKKSKAAVTMLVTHGEPAAKLVDEAKKTKADLIVIGTRGVSELEGLVFGSVAHRVTHLAPYQTKATVIVIR